MIILILPVWLILAHRGKMSGMKVAMTSGLTAGAASMIWFGLAMLYLLLTDTSHDNVVAAPLAGIVIVSPIFVPLFGIASLIGWRIAYRRVPAEGA